MVKICTSIQQSQKLIELGIDTNTADMVYVDCEYLAIIDGVLEEGDIPAWSLVALLGILPKINGLKPILDLEENSIQYTGIDLYVVADNLIDVCHEMILKLHELKLL